MDGLHEAAGCERRLSTREFAALSSLIQQEFGIKMPPAKQVMLEARLQRRLRQLSIGDLSSYVEYLFSEEGRGRELVQLADAVTTNKTDFFREPAHFDFLVREALPALGLGAPRGGTLTAWSAGCSSGEEPYTLAIVLSEYSDRVAPLSFSIQATDLSSAMLERARTAIYDRERIADVPLELQKRYFLQSKDHSRHEVRVKAPLREMVQFSRLNLVDDSYDLPADIDVIFFRNVIIYFSRETQQQIVQRVCGRLRVGGFLFMGHSETLFGMALPLEQVAPTVYRRIA